MKLKTTKSKKDYKILPDDTANLDKVYLDINQSIKQILFFNSTLNKYKVIFYSDNFINKIQGNKYFGIIERNGIHLSRLFTSRLKQKVYLDCFVGTDLQGPDKNTLFFNFDLNRGLLIIKRKIKIGGTDIIKKEVNNATR